MCVSLAACGRSNGIGNDINKKIGRFQSYDMHGKEINESIFTEKDLTILSVWGTFNDSYIEKLPAIAKFAEDLPDNAQLILLACDVRDFESNEYKNAMNTIFIKNVDSAFPCMITTDSLTVFVDQFNDVPTTIFVDKKGNVVGEQFKGEDIARYRAAALEYLE